LPKKENIIKDMEKILIIPILLSFFVTLFSIPFWIRRAKKIGLIWENMNIYEHPKNLPGSGGVITVFGFVFGVLSYVAIKTFILKTNITTVEIFALLTTVLIAGIVGLVDDFLGWHHGGLSAKVRIILLFFAAIPLMVINAGESTMMGINFGILYPLVLIPLGVIGTSATYNFLAGYNGLEASQGIIILSSLALVIFFTGNSWLSLICLCMIVSLIAFYIFNKFPAKVLPGDVMTYSIGALIACIAILGNIEKIAIFFFIPNIIEAFLKGRGRLKKYSFGKVNPDNSLEVPYEKFYGLEHISIYLLKKIKKDGKVYEKDVVYLINFFQIIIIAIGFILFRKSIF
jgi:UDP-N-acetylglucosamine--dolichyl-phosphate N-acetylglucosaminephosphotransferase